MINLNFSTLLQGNLIKQIPFVLGINGGHLRKGQEELLCRCGLTFCLDDADRPASKSILPFLL